MTNTKKTMVIMAGGLGSRYKGLKQIDGILPNNSTILEYSMYDGIRNGFNKFVFIINKHIPETFIEKVSGILNTLKFEYHWIVQDLDKFVTIPSLLENREKPWGTGQAVLCTKDVVNEPFIVINADDFYGEDAYQKASTLIDKEISETKYALIPFSLENTLSKNGSVSRGLCQFDVSGKLDDIEEITDILAENDEIFFLKNEKRHVLPAQSLVSMNFWIFHPSIFPYLEAGFQKFLENSPAIKAEFFLPSLVDELVKAGKVEVQSSATNALWKGVTYPEDKIELQEFLTIQTQANHYPEFLWS